MLIHQTYNAFLPPELAFFRYLGPFTLLIFTMMMIMLQIPLFAQTFGAKLLYIINPVKGANLFLCAKGFIVSILSELVYTLFK